MGQYYTIFLLTVTLWTPFLVRGCTSKSPFVKSTHGGVFQTTAYDSLAGKKMNLVSQDQYLK